MKQLTSLSTNHTIPHFREALSLRCMERKTYGETENKKTHIFYFNHCHLPIDLFASSLLSTYWQKTVPATMGKKGCGKYEAWGGRHRKTACRSQLFPQTIQHEPHHFSEALAVYTNHLFSFPPVTTVPGRQAPHFARSETTSGAERPSSAHFWPLSFILRQDNHRQHLFTSLEMQLNPPTPFTLVIQQLSLKQCLSATPSLIWIWPTDLEVKGSAVHYQSLGPVHSPRKASKYILSVSREISYYYMQRPCEFKTYWGCSVP